MSPSLAMLVAYSDSWRRGRQGGQGGGGGGNFLHRRCRPSHFGSGFAFKCRCHEASGDWVRSVSHITGFRFFHAFAARCAAIPITMNSHPPHRPSPPLLLLLLLQFSLCASSALVHNYGVQLTMITVQCSIITGIVFALVF